MGRARAKCSDERGRGECQNPESTPLQCADPLRGRLMVGRLTLDQVVKVRVLAPQPDKAPAQGAFLFPAEPHSVARGNVGGNSGLHC